MVGSTTLKKLSFLFLPFLFLFLLPQLLFSIEIKNEANNTDLLLMGLGIVRFNYAFVGGDRVTFEESDRGLPAYFSNRTQADLLVEGLYRGYDVSGYLHYRDVTENYEPNYELYLKIGKGLNYLSLGDHGDGVFTDTLFTRFEPEFRGGLFHLEGEKYGFEVTGGAVRGEQTEEEIPADGTSGPYELSNYPVMEGSEAVYIRVRDKDNESRIIKSELYRRGVDYTIDYDDGEIKFKRPVDENDFHGNPVYIAVKYQYDSPGGGYNRYVAGSRFWVLPHEYVKMGFTYLTSGPVGDTVGESLSDRVDIYGTDLTISVEDSFFLGAEFAMSESAAAGENAFASRANLFWELTPDLRIWGGYFRVEKDFPTFGSTSLDAASVIEEITFENPFTFTSINEDYDLNPDIEVGLGTDEESWGLAAEYSIATYHTLTAGYRETRDNVPHEGSLPTMRTRDAFFSYTYTPPNGLSVFSGVQWIQNTDDFSPKTTDSETWRILLGTKGGLGTVGFLGPASFEALYINENYRNFIDRDEDEINNYLLVRFDAQPRDDLKLFLEQHESFVTGRGAGGLVERRDATYAGLLYIRSRFSAEVGYKFIQTDDYVQNLIVEDEHLISTLLSYRPYDTVIAHLKFEYGIGHDREPGSTTRYDEYLGEFDLTWDITPALILNLGYEMEYDIESSLGKDETYQDEASVILEYAPENDILALYLEYKHEREFLIAHPTPKTEINTDTYIFGGKYRFAPDWELVSGLKYSRTYGDAESAKTDGFVEVGYNIFKYLKASLGYEHQDFYDRENPEDDFDADIGYLKLTGSF